MGEREPGGERVPLHERVSRGDLLSIHHPNTETIFSGYGLVVEDHRPAQLVGLLLVDRPRPADPAWLRALGDAFGDYRLAPMTAGGERGLACRMQVEAESVCHLRPFPAPLAPPIRAALQPLLEQPPAPHLRLRWDEAMRLWTSEFVLENVLPPDIRQVFERTGYGCLAAESDQGIIHVCHAADRDIDGFAGKGVWSQWQLLRMPTAPLIRLELGILDDPTNPYRFESFLNVAEPDQAAVLARLANQDHLQLAFYGDGLRYRYTISLTHDKQQWQQLDDIVTQAEAHWQSLPSAQRDFNRAKAAFLRRGW